MSQHLDEGMSEEARDDRASHDRADIGRATISVGLLGNLITLFVMLLGLAVSWGSLNAKIDFNAELLNKLQQQTEAIRSTQIQVLEEQGRVRGTLDEHEREDAGWRMAHPGAVYVPQAQRH